MNMSLALRLPRKMHLLKCPTPAIVLEMLQNPHVCSLLTRCTIPCACHARETTSERPKVVRTRQFFTLLTWKCASRHNGVHFLDISTSKNALNLSFFFTRLTSKCASRHNGVRFFDIATSKSAPTLVCFVHFDLEMRFAPQRRAIFHLSFGQLAPHPPL